MSAPTGRPPAGGDEDHSHLLLVVIWVEASLGAIIMIARLFTRAYVAHNLGWDDFWMVITWITGIISNCLDTVGLHYGIARHMYYLSPENTSKALQMDWVTHAFAITSTGLGKIAFAVFLLRILPKGKKWMRRFLHGYNALLIAVNIPLLIITYAQCDPVAGLWKPTIGAKCWPPHIQASYAVFQGSYGAAADFILALFPVFIVWNLQVNGRTKLGLACLMCLGVFASGCAIAKTYYLPLMTVRADFTWETQYMIIWFTTEMYSIIIAATVPTLRPLFLWMAGKNFRSGGHGNRYHIYENHNYGLSDLSSQRSKIEKRADRSAPKNEGDSDRSILYPGLIQKTTNINVTYDETSSRKEKVMDWSLPDDDRRSVHPEEKV